MAAQVTCRVRAAGEDVGHLQEGIARALLGPACDEVSVPPTTGPAVCVDQGG